MDIIIPQSIHTENKIDPTQKLIIGLILNEKAVVIRIAGGYNKTRSEGQPCWSIQR